ncbi:hypothetical protein F5Y06DRAFT_300412 [Hypoxylon sp. FL0890]|nr:hypothetical protein F5Y06DRAFT_300412 [Hypoxylon sp. FL0890]
MNFGSAIGTSISGAIWRSNLLLVAQKFPVGSSKRLAIYKAYRETQKLLAVAATCVWAPTLLAMWFIKNVDLSKRQNEKKGEEGDERDSHKNAVGRSEDHEKH